MIYIFFQFLVLFFLFSTLRFLFVFVLHFSLTSINDRKWKVRIYVSPKGGIMINFMSSYVLMHFLK